MRIRTLLLLLMVSLFLLVGSYYAYSACILDCVLQTGTVCVSDQCVPKVGPVPTPTPTPATSDIKLTLKPYTDPNAIAIDCTGMDMKNIRVILKRNLPPPSASFYSMIFYFDETLDVHYFYAQKDIMNKFVFLSLWPDERILPQHIGLDFMFNVWIDQAFNDFFATRTCAELKAFAFYFEAGISVKGDRSDYERAIFTFR